MAPSARRFPLGLLCVWIVYRSLVGYGRTNLDGRVLWCVKLVVEKSFLSCYNDSASRE
jgi:hypothetical protein